MRWFLMIFGVFSGIVWSFLAIRNFWKIRAYGFAHPSPRTAETDQAQVEAIVPAHNEERVVEATVRDILAQDHPGLTLTVIDDQSTDGTGAILDRLAEELPGLKVIHGVTRPLGWVGKTWALSQGVSTASADWILFVDADMRLHPAALTSALAQAEQSGADLVSFLPKCDCHTIWQAAIGITLIQTLMIVFPLDRANDPDRPEAIAAGGFILVRRSVYERAGGHEAVRSEIIEDINLARNIKAAGGKIVVRPAPSLLSTHMYGSLAEIWQGLRKNAYAGMDYMPHKYVTGVIAAIGLAWTPWLCLIAWRVTGHWSTWGRIGLWGVIAQAATALPAVIFLQLPALCIFLLPVGMTLYAGIATSSALDYHRGRILWKGRTLRTDEIFSESQGESKN